MEHFDVTMRPIVGKLYLAVSIPYEGHIFYEVPSNTKIIDFLDGGKHYKWAQEQHERCNGIDFIFKCVDQLPYE